MVNQEPCFLPVGPGKLCNCWLLCLSVFLAFNVFLALSLFFSMGICASAHNCKGSLVNHSRYVLQSRVYLLYLAPAKHGYYPMTLWLYRCNFKRCVIMYAVKNRQSVKGEPLSAPPKKERESEKEIKRGGGVSHFSHHCSGISLLHCGKQSLPQVGEWLSFPDDLCETAIQFPQKQESISGSNGPFVSMATGVKLWHWLRATYLSCLLRSARAASAPAPAPASLVTLGRWEGEGSDTVRVYTDPLMINHV